MVSGSPKSGSAVAAPLLQVQVTVSPASGVCSFSTSFDWPAATGCLQPDRGAALHAPGGSVVVVVVLVVVVVVLVQNGIDAQPAAASHVSLVQASPSPHSASVVQLASSVEAQVPGERSSAHSSRPVAGVVAVKYRCAHAATRSLGADPSGPATRSATRVVPLAVPSLCQSSAPAAASLATKKSVPLTSVSSLGASGDSSVVPDCVPLLVQSSSPPAASRRNARRPPTAVSSFASAARSSNVPAAVPSLRQRAAAAVPSPRTK